MTPPMVEESVVTVRNPAGNITPSLIRAIKKAYLAILHGEKQQLIKIIGEDDLAGVPAILFSPLGSVVLYGQPAYVSEESGLRRGKHGEGIVLVEISAKKKEELFAKIAV